MRKKDAATESGSEWSRPAGGRVSPLDVQQKEFRVTRVGVGYRMREVDEFLDQVTDTLSALIAENEQLRASSGAAPSATSAPDAHAREAATPAGRAAVDAFLQQEKGFLQELGGLVQAHAQELRSMIRSTRDAPTMAMTREERAPEQEPVPEQQPIVEDEPVAGSVADAEPVTEGEEPAPTTERVEEVPPSEPVASNEDEGDQPAATTGVIEEPIRLEDPEPARSRRSEEKDGDSLRELFWGEE